MTATAALLAASLGTYALRQISVRALAHRQLPPAIGVTLRHTALAVMAALVMSSLPRTGGLGLPSTAAMGGLVAAGIAARHTKHITAAIAIGITTYAVANTIQGVLSMS